MKHWIRELLDVLGTAAIALMIIILIATALSEYAIYRTKNAQQGELPGASRLGFRLEMDAGRETPNADDTNLQGSLEASSLNSERADPHSDSAPSHLVSLDGRTRRHDSTTSCASCKPKPLPSGVFAKSDRNIRLPHNQIQALTTPVNLVGGVTRDHQTGALSTAGLPPGKGGC